MALVRPAGDRASTSHLARATSYKTCNVHLEPMDLHDAIDRVIEFGLSGAGKAVHLCNAYTLSLTANDLAYASVIDRGDLNLTDGMPLAWLARRLGFEVDRRSRPRGCDVFVGAVVKGQEIGLRHYLYGGTDEVVHALRRRLRELAPNACIVGSEAPPFRALNVDERAEVVARVRGSGANVVWVGLGTPKQDQFIDELRDDMEATLVAVGAAFDFIAGAKSEAPLWIRRSGLEWVYRLASEPRRLWKRYLVGNLRFIAGAVRTGAFVSAR